MASAQPKIQGRTLKQRNAKIARDKTWVTMSVSWRDVVNKPTRKKLLSGLPTVIAMRAYVFADKAQQPLSLSIQTCKVVFDLWDEVFRVDVRRAGQRRQTIAVNVEGVLRRCGEARRLPVVKASRLTTSQKYFVGVLVEVNPLSKKTMERIKRWVARPKGVGAVGPGDSLFGSFVGLFITHVPDADRTLSFRTPGFVPAKLPVAKPPARGKATKPRS